MQRHESYKPSGVKWLGAVPSHWEVQALRAVTQLKSDRNRPDLPVLSVYREYGVIRKDSRDDNHNATSLDTSTYKVVQPGDLVVNKMKAWQGSMGVSAHEGIVSPAYITCATKSEQVLPGYLHYLLRSSSLIGVYNSLSYGVRVGQWDMHYEDFKQIPIPIPPIEEQGRIVTFLDQKTAEINDAIEKKERLIELLNEQKSAMVKQAATRGLNLNAPIQESGVDWIGDIPAHWQVSSLSHQAVIFAGGTPDRSAPRYWGGEIPWIKTGEVNFNRISSAEEHITDAGLRNSAAKIAPAGTLLMAMYGQGVTRGRVAILDVPAAFNQACVAMKFGCNISTDFAFFYFYGAYSFLRDSGNESSQMNLSSGAISKFKITIPPLHEQDQICKHLRNALEIVNAAEQAQRHTVDTLHAMKQSLTTEAVTGKIRA